MTRKQELCQMLMQDGFVFIRNQEALCHRPWWSIAPWRWKDNARSCYWVALILHNLPSVAFNPEFTDRDIWYLNQLQSFFEQAGPRVSQYFSPKCRQLFDLVPASLKYGLDWDGPQPPERTPKQQHELDEHLFWAVKHNSNIETLRSALVLGANLSARDEQGRTALRIATELDKTEYVQELRKAGAKE